MDDGMPSDSDDDGRPQIKQEKDEYFTSISNIRKPQEPSGRSSINSGRVDPSRNESAGIPS